MREYEVRALLKRFFVSEDAMGEERNTVDALDSLAHALKWLGNADASTPMGALEAHGAAMLEAAEKIQAGLSDVAEAIREHGEG